MAMLTDGFSLRIDISGAGTTLEEISGKIPGIMGGNRIKLSTMRNTAWHTYAAQALKDLTEATLQVAYDSAYLSTITGLINTPRLMTYTLPDESTYKFWGFIETFEPSDFQIGERPTAALKISPTNVDASGDEYPPEYTAPAP